MLRTGVITLAIAMCALAAAPAASDAQSRGGLFGLLAPQAPPPPPPPATPPPSTPPATGTVRTVPLGTAAWYACADKAYSGPAILRCPVASFNPRYRETLLKSFDRMTPENEFKMLFTQPQKGRFDFAVADQLAKLASDNGKGIRGHALIYAAANPAWVDKPLVPWTRSSLLTTMRTHITTMVNRYKARGVREWDVVNEPLTGTGARDQNVYQRVIGDGWIEEAFRAARAADPGARLILNEFDADVPGPRHTALLSLARDFKLRGVPIDGVGLEMHVGAGGSYPSLGQVKTVMASYAAIGLDVEITELDVLRPVSGDPAIVQRTAYDTVARACQESSNCTGVTVWGVADPYSWRSAAQTATVFTGSAPKPDADTGQFNRKLSYDRLRCYLKGPVTTQPRDCGAIEVTPPGATAQVTGPADGGSAASDPPG